MQAPNFKYHNGEVEHVDSDEKKSVEEQWIKSLENWKENGQQMSLDQLATEQTAGYYSDEQGNWIDRDGEESPTNVFSQEAYWTSEQRSEHAMQAEDKSPRDGNRSFTESNFVNSEAQRLAEGKSQREMKKSSKNDRAKSSSRRKKSKMERIQQRQALLEKEEEERLHAQETADVADEKDDALEEDRATALKASKLSKNKKPGFVDREKAKFQLKMCIVKAIKRSRMPVQIRILPTTRKCLTPMEKYFGSKSVECVLSDIFWASIKGDFGRVKHLVEVEGVSPVDSILDPWNLHQTPLHWAAKGGSVSVIQYLLAAGASPKCVDENGSIPLHLSCWVGHVDASIVLLQASDAKDLYVQDYDAAMCPLDWANVRGHTTLLKAIEKYQDSLWLPKFVDDLVRGIIRYKVKIFKDSPKKLIKAAAEVPVNADTVTKSADPKGNFR